MSCSPSRGRGTACQVMNHSLQWGSPVLHILVSGPLILRAVLGLERPEGKEVGSLLDLVFAPGQTLRTSWGIRG